MPVCRLRFQMELNLVRKKKKFKKPPLVLWFCEPRLALESSCAGSSLQIPASVSRGIRWEVLNAFYSELRARLMILFLPCKGTDSFWVCWRWVPKVGNGSWCEGVPESRRTRCTSVPSPGEVNLEFFFWVLFCKRNIVLVLTWSYHNCNKILKDFIIADWFLWF